MGLLEILAMLWHLICFLIVNIYYTICIVAYYMAWPFVWLYKWVKEKLEFTAVGLFFDDWNDRFCLFNGLVPFCLLIAGFIYSIIVLLVNAGVNGGLLEYVQTLMFHTPVGSFVGFFNDGLNFTPMTAVSIAFSGTLFGLCMGSRKPENFGEFMLDLLRRIVFFVAFAHLALLLSGVFQAVGDWGFNIIVNLYNAETHSFFPTLGKILLFMALKEYAECIFFGIVFLLALIVLTILLQFVFKVPRDIQNLITSIVGIVLIFVVDLFRPYIDKLLHSRLKERSIYPSHFLDNVLGID